MIRLAWMWLGVFLLVVPAVTGASGQTGSSPAHSPQAASAAPLINQAPSASPPATYTLTPERRAKAIAYSRSLYALYFLGTLLSIIIYLLLWRTRLAVTFREWAQRISGRLIIQCLIFVPLLLAAAALLKLPLNFYSGYVLEHRFGLSTQGLASWFGDWGKSVGIGAALRVVVAWFFYSLVRNSPRRWWFHFWLVSIPLILTFILIEPCVIDPLFYRFTPLQKTQPELVQRIGAMLSHAGVWIPPERIYAMDASSKTKEVDAYVTGFGASKRVVVWDTTLKTMGPDELLLVLGHETGHYALHHIPKEFALDEDVALVFFFLGFLVLNWLVKNVGPRGGVEGMGDIASLPLVLTVLTLLVFLSDPLVNGISRYFEHQADQFGLEVAYGVVPDPNATEVHAFQILGDVDLADPDPSPFIKFWLYTHPPLDERIRFAATYKPWAEGKPLQLIPGENVYEIQIIRK
ncbi:MAG: M48 family metallopeptidase [Acidobacteriota bacterium]|nr:M48 family metallopeptidase [Acidobacteriota bacterium]